MQQTSQGSSEYTNIMQDIANSKTAQERQQKFVNYKSKLMEFQQQGYPVENDLRYLGG